MLDSSTIQIRPRFKLLIKDSLPEIERKINTHLERSSTSCYGKISYGFGTIQIPRKEQHYWSPQLTISLEQTDDGTEIRGLYGPKPSIWTMFVFFYATIGFVFIITLIIGMTNISLDKESTIIWLSPILLILFFSLYLISYLGQKKGRPQLISLERFIEDALEIKMNDYL